MTTTTTPSSNPPCSDDESKVNKATPALVDAFVQQLQRDAAATPAAARGATPGRRLPGSGGATAWGARSWEE